MASGSYENSANISTFHAPYNTTSPASLKPVPSPQYGPAVELERYRSQLYPRERLNFHQQAHRVLAAHMKGERQERIQEQNHYPLHGRHGQTHPAEPTSDSCCFVGSSRVGVRQHAHRISSSICILWQSRHVCEKYTQGETNKGERRVQSAQIGTLKMFSRLRGHVLLTLCYEDYMNPRLYLSLDLAQTPLSRSETRWPMATKYQFVTLRTGIVKHDWPATIDQWDLWDEEKDNLVDSPSLGETAVEGYIPEACASIRLAMDFNIPSMLPAAYRYLTRIGIDKNHGCWGSSEEFDDEENASLVDFTARWKLLHVDDFRALLRRRANLRRVATKSCAIYHRHHSISSSSPILEPTRIITLTSGKVLSQSVG